MGTGDIRSHNTFDEPDRVQPEDVTLDGNTGLNGFPIPPQSVTTVRLKKER
jgi:hypothetical protein